MGIPVRKRYNLYRKSNSVSRIKVSGEKNRIVHKGNIMLVDEGVMKHTDYDAAFEELHRLIGLEESIQTVVRQLRISTASVLRYASLIRSETQEMSTRQNVEKLYLDAKNASTVFENVIARGNEKVRPSCGVCDAGSILGQACSLLSYQLKAEGIILDIIPPSEPLPVKADPFRLQQAFYIALLNALQLQISSPGEKKIQIASGIERKQVRIDISIRNPGLFVWSGEDLLKQFFETLGKGMGMGWYSLKRTLAGHRGSITIQCGESVSFSIMLPCAAPGSISLAAEPGTGADRRPSALIIDDEVMTGGVTAEMMNHLGFETVYFDCPLSALPLLRVRSFSIIMIDYLMPEMNGVEFVTEHGSLFGDADVILMTGLSSLDISAIDKVRRVSVLKKPFAFKELTCLVQETKTKIRQQANG